MTSRCMGWLGIAALGASVLIMSLPSTPAYADPVDPVDPVELGVADSFAVLGPAAVGNTAGCCTKLRGNLGSGAALTGFGLGDGTYTGDLYEGAATAPFLAAVQTAYDDARGRLGGTPVTPAAMTTPTFMPGVHNSAAALTAGANAVITLDAQGDPNAVFIFQVGGALTLGANTTVVLTNEAQARNVFWQVVGGFDLGADSTFVGTLLVHDAIGIGEGSVVNGRALALTGAIGLNNNQFYSSPPAVAIGGGAAASTTDTSPTITGSTTERAPSVVTVTVNGETLFATPDPGGMWSATPVGLLANATYSIVASVVDGAGNTGSFTQALTVDTVLPDVTIDGDSTVITNDPTPTISGSTDVAAGRLVTLIMARDIPAANFTRTTLVQTDGTWNITPNVLSAGEWEIRATVTDPAGNQNGATQTLLLDVTAPVAAIDEGATALTNDPTPTITGTAVGATVTATLDGQALSPIARVGDLWSVTYTGLPLGNGSHHVSMTATDPAGNATTATQALTVDTVPPLITINPGPNDATNDPTPTISGTTDVAPGASVSVSIDGASPMTAVVQSGNWNVTPSAVLVTGVYPVVASVVDTAGNIGTSTQTLTLDITPPTVTIDGGSSRTTPDATPTIAGASGDVAVGSGVTVTVAGQTLPTTIGVGGIWVVTAAAMANGTHVVTVTVTDAAGNDGYASQSLTIDTAVPVVTPPPTTPPPTNPPPTNPPPTNPPAQSAGFASVGPKRVFDTRAGQSPNALRSVAKQQVGGGYVLRVQMTSLGGYVPASGVGAVSLNVTSTGSTVAGFITVYACGARELVASVNFPGGGTVANAVVAPVSADGAVCFYANALTDIVVDINGWFAAGAAFTTVGPKRVFDTRADNSPDALRDVAKVSIAAGEMIEVRLTDLAGYVPADGVGTVSLNIAVANPRTAGFITVYSCGTRALVSSLNYVAGQTIANAVIAPVSASGTVCFYSLATADLIVDINGWMRAGSGFTGVNPARVLDTRVGESPNALRNVIKAKVGGSYVLEVRVTNLPGLVPASGVAAVSLNVVATNPDAAGFVTVFACGTIEEVASLNYAAGQTVGNAVLASVSATGTICLYSNAPTDVVVDINGWISADAG